MRNSDTDQQEKQSRQREQVVAKAVRNRDRTRQSLLRQGRKLARRRAKNVECTRDDEDESDSSTIVSRHSTVPSVDSNERAAARHSHSTVPSRPKGSTVPAAPRLYGLDLHARLRSETESVDETPTATESPEETAADDTPGPTEEGEEG
jgi:hypothetical protein